MKYIFRPSFLPGKRVRKYTLHTSKWCAGDELRLKAVAAARAPGWLAGRLAALGGSQYPLFLVRLGVAWHAVGKEN